MIGIQIFGKLFDGEFDDNIHFLDNSLNEESLIREVEPSIGSPFTHAKYYYQKKQSKIYIVWQFRLYQWRRSSSAWERCSAFQQDPLVLLR